MGGWVESSVVTITTTVATNITPTITNAPPPPPLPPPPLPPPPLPPPPYLPADANWRRRHTVSANDVGDRRSRASNPYISDAYSLPAVNLDDGNDRNMGDTYSNPSPSSPVLKTVKGKRGMPPAGL